MDSLIMENIFIIIIVSKKVFLLLVFLVFLVPSIIIHIHKGLLIQAGRVLNIVILDTLRDYV